MGHSIRKNGWQVALRKAPQYHLKHPFDLPKDDEADALLEESIWDQPSSSASGGKSLFRRRLGIISNLMLARKRYKVFYDNSSLQMIVAYVRGICLKFKVQKRTSLSRAFVTSSSDTG